VAILFATPFLSQSDIAVFGVCLKLSLLVGYFVQIAQQIAIPDLADARGKGDLAGMRRAARRSILLPLAFTSAAVLGCFVLGRQVLEMFGAEFGTARDVLVIMVATQVVRAMAGPSAHLLTLTGAQRLNAALCAGALVALFVANWMLGQRFGPAGAAWAVVISYTGWIVATAVAVRRLGEMRTDVVALFLSRPTGAVAAVREAPAAAE
jgi:O-antigen/teichoic acid export membrane protein